MADGDGLALQIDGAPSQPQHLASAQTVIGGNLHAQFKGIAFHRIKQLQHLALSVEGAVVDILFGAVNFIGRIFCDNVFPYRTLQCLADDCVVMDHGVCRAVVTQDLLIEVLDVLRGQILEFNLHRFEVRGDPGFDHIGVALVCGGGDGGLDAAQPLFHVLGKFQSSFRGVFFCQDLFLGFSPDAFFFRLLILAADLIKHLFCLAFAGFGHRQLCRDPFHLSFSINFEIQQRIVVSIFLLQATCYHDEPPCHNKYQFACC